VDDLLGISVSHEGWGMIREASGSNNRDNARIAASIEGRQWRNSAAKGDYEARRLARASMFTCVPQVATQ
jgi:hypothetical protein